VPARRGEVGRRREARTHLAPLACDPVHRAHPAGHLLAREALGEDDAERTRRPRLRGRRRGDGSGLVAADRADARERGPPGEQEAADEHHERHDAAQSGLSARRASPVAVTPRH
jgi:hypothetical protein